MKEKKNKLLQHDEQSKIQLDKVPSAFGYFSNVTPTQSIRFESNRKRRKIRENDELMAGRVGNKN